MRHIQYSVVGSLLLAMPLLLHAQTKQPKDSAMNRVVVVEQEYNPEIMDASKVNVLPEVTEPEVVKRKVEYAVASAPAGVVPAGQMQAYTFAERQSDPFLGYLRAGYGNYGNLDVAGNYLFRLSAKDRLNIRLQSDGMNGKLDMPAGTEWKSKFYRLNSGVDYTHRFRSVDFNLGAGFGMSSFNYPVDGMPDQRFLSGDFRVGVGSSDEASPLQFRAETALLMFSRKHNNFAFDNDAATETQVHTKGWVGGRIDDEQYIRIGADLRNIFYSEDNGAAAARAPYDSRTTLGLNPRYELRSEHWNLRAGASVDFAFGGGKTLRVAPDVKAEYVFADSYAVFLQAVGGRRASDFRRLELLCPYALPVSPVLDTYEQANASLGFKASPCPGLWFRLQGGFQRLKDDLFQAGVAFIDLEATDTHNFYGGFSLDYDYREAFTLSLDATYRNWDGDREEALLLKPEAELKGELSVRPVSGLSVSAGYEYASRVKTGFGRMAAVNNLHAGAEYRFYKHVSIYARLNNLLNKDYMYYLGYPVEGFNFYGGVVLNF